MEFPRSFFALEFKLNSSIPQRISRIIRLKWQTETNELKIMIQMKVIPSPKNKKGNHYSLSARRKA